MLAPVTPREGATGTRPVLWVRSEATVGGGELWGPARRRRVKLHSSLPIRKQALGYGGVPSPIPAAGASSHERDTDTPTLNNHGSCFPARSPVMSTLVVLNHLTPVFAVLGVVGGGVASVGAVLTFGGIATKNGSVVALGACMWIAGARLSAALLFSDDTSILLPLGLYAFPVAAATGLALPRDQSSRRMRSSRLGLVFEGVAADAGSEPELAGDGSPLRLGFA